MAVNWDVEKLINEARDAANGAVALAAESILSNAVAKILNPPKSGIIYKRKGVEHQASAPDEAPASDTGRLAASGRVIPNLENLSAVVNFSTEYAAALEFGRKDGKILPRPYARPALAEESKGFRDGVKAAVVRVVDAQSVSK